MITIDDLRKPRLELHCHTNASDGSLTPTALVDLAVQRGITTLAITDHDTIDGLPEAASAADGRAELIAGIEFGCHMPFGEMHMLGYLFDPTNVALAEKLSWLRRERKLRGRRMVEKLNHLGVPVAWERVQELAGAASVGRPHISQALIEGGWAADHDEAFDRYLGWGRPAYVQRVALQPVEVIELMRAAGGVAAVAHPAAIPALETVLPPLVEAGLAGLESYYGEYDEETVTWLATLAGRFGLVPTGGSDYHGRPIKDHAYLGSGPTVPPDTVDRLRARRGSRE